MIIDKKLIAGKSGDISMLYGVAIGENKQIYTGACYLWGGVFSTSIPADGAGDDVVIYDNVEEEIIYIFYSYLSLEGPVVFVLPYPIKCNNGLYVVEAGTASTILFYSI